MSSSTENSSTSAVAQEAEAASLIPFGAGYAAPPPTPLASLPPCHPPHGFLPLQSNPTAAADDDDNQFLMPSSSSNTSSPPSKQDLDALAQYLLQQSLHSTPNLLASPTLQRKRRTSTSVAAVDVHANSKQEGRVENSRNGINFEQVVQTFTYAGGFCEESRRGIGKACQEVGAFNILVEDAEEALLMLKGRHGADNGSESRVEGGLITLSQLLTSTSQCHQHDVLDIDLFTFDSSFDTTFRDTMTRFANLLSSISKDVLRFLLEDLPIETQANIRGHSLKPLLHIYGNGKQEMKLEDDVALFISYNIGIRKSEMRAFFLARMGPQLQTWSQGKYKAPFLKSLYDNDNGEIRIQFALTQHH